MKKLFILCILILSAITVKSQSYIKTNIYGLESNRNKIDSALHIPSLKDTLAHGDRDTSAQIRLVNGQFYYHFGKWRQVQGSGGGTTPVDGIWHWDGTSFNPYTALTAGKFSNNNTLPTHYPYFLAYDGDFYASHIYSSYTLGTNNGGSTSALNADEFFITIGLTNRLNLFPNVTNSSTAIPYFFDTNNALTTTGAKLLSINNHGVEKFYIDKDGNTYANGVLLGSGGGGSPDTTKTPLLGHYGTQYDLSKKFNKTDTLPFSQVKLGATDTANISTIFLPMQKIFAPPYKISFNHTNTQYLPYTVNSNITVTPDTAGSFSNASTAADFIGDGTHTIYFNGFSSSNGSAIDSFIPTNNYVSTYLFGKIGKYTYKYKLQDYKPTPGAPTQLLAPINFVAVDSNQSIINVTWNANILASSMTILDSIVGTSSNFSTLASGLSNTTTKYQHTGLTTGKTVYYKGQWLGNGISTLNSNYSLTNATTSNLITLSAPTLNAPTVVSQTQINLSDNANISSNSGYTWLISRNSGSTYSPLATTATNTYTYNFTTGHADSLYFFKDRANGDLVTYNNSPYSNVVSATTLGTSPTLNNAYTSTNGDTVYAIFNKAMNAPNTTGWNFSSNTLTNVILHPTNSSMYDFTLSTPYTSSSTITMGYTPGTITSQDGGSLSSFSSYGVTNNVSSSQPQVYHLTTYGTEYFIYDMYSPLNLSLTGSTVNTINDQSGNSNNLPYGSGTKATYSSPSLTWNNGNYNIASTVNIGHANTMVIVANFNNTIQNDYIGSSAGYTSKVGVSSSVIQYFVPGSFDGAYASITSAQITGIHVYIIVRNGSTFQLYVDGVLSSNTYNVLDNSDYLLASGSGLGGQGSNWSTGQFYYFGAVNSVINSTQVSTITADLLTRF
jgi:hypothetical protein